MRFNKSSFGELSDGEVVSVNDSENVGLVWLIGAYFDNIQRKIAMSINYAAGLSPFEHKGKCGMAETFDSDNELKKKMVTFTESVRSSRHMVVITGAGISTSCGIPDFRGPKGVWTLEQKGEEPIVDVTFDTARPSLTHMALVALERKGIVKHLISQNVDGLHLRSGFPRDRISELHGNMFVEDCEHCYAQYIRKSTLPTMALRPTGHMCTQTKSRGRCRGRLRDTILDWEDSLPELDAVLAEQNCKQADLCLCLGTSLQIVPCGNYPLMTKRNGGKIVIVNLQTTKHDKKSDLKINHLVDQVMQQLCDDLDINIPAWTRPVVNLHSTFPAPAERQLPKLIVDSELLPEVDIISDSDTKLALITDDSTNIDQTSVNTVDCKSEKEDDKVSGLVKIKCESHCNIQTDESDELKRSDYDESVIHGLCSKPKTNSNIVLNDCSTPAITSGPKVKKIKVEN